MSRKNLDARKYNQSTKKAEFPLGELLPEEQRKKLRPEPPEEEPLPTEETAEKLPPPVEKLPGGPQQTVRPKMPGQTSESRDVPGYTKHEPKEHTGLTPEEFKAKQKELGVEKEPTPGTWSQILQEKLKHLTPEFKTKQKLEEKYGPGEKLQEVAQTLADFGRDMATTDITGAQTYVMGLDLPDIIRDRAERILRGKRLDPGNPAADENGEVPISGEKIFQHALNQMKARSRKQIQEATNWLDNEPAGKLFLERARDQYLIQQAVRMIENAVLRQEGEGVILQPTGLPRGKEQKTEQRRLKKLKDQLDKGEITQEQFDRLVKGLPKTEAEEEVEEPTATPSTLVQLNELQHKFNTGEISEEEYKRERARLLAQGNVLSFKKQSDTTGPGGEDWFSGYESGPQVNRDKYKVRKRFPFQNAPSEDVRVDKGPAHHDLPVPDGHAPAADDSWGLLASSGKIQKTANNDMFESFNFGELTKGPWISYTIFKKAYKTLKPGDIVVQYGKSPKDVITYRRRFGSIKSARKNISAALLPAAEATLRTIAIDGGTLPKSVRLPGKPVPSDSLNQLPDSKDSSPTGGVYGPHTEEYDKEPWQGNRDGFDRPRPRRKMDVERNVFPYEDQEVSNQTKIFKNLNLQKKAMTNEEFNDARSNFEDQISKLSKEIVTFLSNLRRNLEGQVPDENMDLVLSEELPKFLEKYQQHYKTLGFNSDTIKEAVDKAIPFLHEKEIYINELPVLNAIPNLFPPPPRGITQQKESMTPEESKLINSYTSDEIWNMASNSDYFDTPEQDIARSVITKGLIASKLNLRKFALHKFAGWNLTDKGKEILSKDFHDFRTNPENQHLVWFLNLINMYPDKTIEQALEEYLGALQGPSPFTANAVNMLNDIRDGANIATENGYAVYAEPEFQEGKFDLPENMPLKSTPSEWNWDIFPSAKKLNLKKQGEVGGYAAPVVETPEERAATIEQTVPKPINIDPARPFNSVRRKRHDLNETQLYNENEYADQPRTLMSKNLNLRKTSARLYITPTGQQEFEKFRNTEIDIDPNSLDPNQNIHKQIAEHLPNDIDFWLMGALEEIQNNPGTNIGELIKELTNNGFPKEDILLFEDAIRRALQLNLIEESFDLPGNMPEGIAKKLNLQKKAFDFNVSMFDPNTNQFLDQTVISATSFEQAQLQAQEFVNKSHPGATFQVTDVNPATPRTMGINSVSESKFMSQLNLKKHSQEDLALRNQLLNLYTDILGDQEITADSVNNATKQAVTEFKLMYPTLTPEQLNEVAQEADSLFAEQGKPTNFVNTMAGNPLF